MKYQSAAPFFLHANPFGYDAAGGPINNLRQQSLKHPGSCSFLFSVFEEELISRRMPDNLLAEDAQWLKYLGSFYKGMQVSGMPGCCVSNLSDVYISHEVIYFGGQPESTVLYELARPCDRPAIILEDDVHHRRYRQFTVQNDDTLYFYLGSAGSRNYGHWLTDDTPRLAAVEKVAQLLPEKRVCVVISSTEEQGVNQVRKDTIASHPRLKDVNVELISPSDTYHFDQLLYATPVSFHPTAKLRSAIAYVRANYIEPGSARRRRIYVTRPPSSTRCLVNNEEIVAYLRDLSFEIVDCAQMSFIEQVKMFQDAEIVVGVMGAAMTNTIFSPVDAPIVYISCTGWSEPYYWDLADACGQNYSCIYGTLETGHTIPHISPFSVRLDDLRSTISTLLA